MDEKLIEVSHLSKTFDGNHHVLKDINLFVNRGEVVSIIGPSGTGKSTLLRCLNYLTIPTKGLVRINDSTINADSYTKKDILELRKHSAMVFQNYNLFKNKTVLENIIEAPLLVQKRNRNEVVEEAEELLKSINLFDKKGFYPSKLSGGQQQRVGILRAMAMKPDVLLFDEPTSALDPQLVGEVLNMIKMLAESGKTMILVTHEIKFAQRVSDRIIFMNDGKIEAEGKPDEIIADPKNEKLKQFLKTEE